MRYRTSTVLSLYDDERLRGPSGMASRPSGEEIESACAGIAHLCPCAKQQVVFSPAPLPALPLKRSSLSGGKRDPNFRHVVYDAVSLSAMRAANAQSFGQARSLIILLIRRASSWAWKQTFWAQWLSPVEFARQYAANRKPKERRHSMFSFEI